VCRETYIKEYLISLYDGEEKVGYLMKGYFISKKYYYSLEVELIYQCMLHAQVNHITFHL
jgi:hypothetical protein